MTRTLLTEAKIREVLGEHAEHLLAFVQNLGKAYVAFAAADVINSYVADRQARREVSWEIAHLGETLNRTLRTLATLAGKNEFTLGWLANPQDCINLTDLVFIARVTYGVPTEAVPHEGLWWQMHKVIEAQGRRYMLMSER